MTSFNLVHDPWIRVLFLDLRKDKLSIADVMANAHRIKRLDFRHSGDNMAVYRLLLAISIWCRGSLPTASEYQEDTTGPLPEAWLQYLKDNAGFFEILGDDRRFFQIDASELPSKKPWNKKPSMLFYELPQEKSTTHLSKVFDVSVGVSLEACVLGLVRMPILSTPTGSGYSAGSLNNAVFFVLEGKHLASTLRLNMKPMDVPLGVPSWVERRELPISGHVPLLESMTYLPRRTRLGPIVRDGYCSLNGTRGPLIEDIYLRSNGGLSLIKDPTPEQLAFAQTHCPDMINKKNAISTRGRVFNDPNVVLTVAPLNVQSPKSGEKTREFKAYTFALAKAEGTLSNEFFWMKLILHAASFSDGCHRDAVGVWAHAFGFDKAKIVGFIEERFPIYDYPSVRNVIGKIMDARFALMISDANYDPIFKIGVIQKSYEFQQGLRRIGLNDLKAVEAYFHRFFAKLFSRSHEKHPLPNHFLNRYRVGRARKKLQEASIT